MELETERLWLRPLLAEDARIYAALWSDARVHPWIVEEGPVPASAVPSRVARKMRQWVEGTGSTWSLVHDGQVIGFVALHPLQADGLGPQAALSYAVVPRCWRRGFAREALGAVMAAAGSLGVERIVARVHPDNPGSAELLGALGFVEQPPEASPPRRVFGWPAPT